MQSGCIMLCMSRMPSSRIGFAAVALAVLGLAITSVQRAVATTTVPNAAKYSLTAPPKVDGDHPGLSATISLPAHNTQIIAMGMCLTPGYRMVSRVATMMLATSNPPVFIVDNNRFTLADAQYSGRNFFPFLQCGYSEQNSGTSGEDISLGVQLDSSNVPSRLLAVNNGTKTVTINVTLIW